MPEPAAVPAKRACDACHRRKVRCILEVPGLPCKNCGHAGLQCTFNAPIQKKGPKGCRAKVISELRETQHQTSKPVSVVGIGSPPLSPVVMRAASPLPFELVQCCVDFFFQRMFPTQPILERSRLQRSIANMNSSAEDYCLIVSLCAYMMIQPNMQLPSALDAEADVRSNLALGISLLEDALHMRKTCSHYESPSADAVTTSFFFFGCYFCLEKHNTAWFHLREATTLALLMGMHQEPVYRTMDPIDATLTRRLFWLLFVTERAYALQTQKPLTLHDTIALPSVWDGEHESPELIGFNHLIMLFKPFDDAFVGLWNQSLDNCNTAWISMLHKQLADALPQYLRSTETQAVDLKTSQQWLRVMVWQLSISHRLLSSNSADASMTFRYPLELSRQLIAESSQFSQQAMEVHGIGLVKKLFDVACTLIDVMACVPCEPAAGFEVGPRDYLGHFLTLMGRLRGGQERYLPLVLQKIDDTLPQGLPASLISPTSTFQIEGIDGLKDVPGMLVPGTHTGRRISYTPWDAAVVPVLKSEFQFSDSATQQDDSAMSDVNAVSQQQDLSPPQMQNSQQSPHQSPQPEQQASSFVSYPVTSANSPTSSLFDSMSLATPSAFASATIIGQTSMSEEMNQDIDSLP